MQGCSRCPLFKAFLLLSVGRKGLTLNDAAILVLQLQGLKKWQVGRKNGGGEVYSEGTFGRQLGFRSISGFMHINNTTISFWNSGTSSGLFFLIRGGCF